MKYYFPTTTLNFNNILSSESISPADFYPTRGFGYKRWKMLDEQQPKAFIVLYDKLCYFKRPSSGQEDHPLIIEIELEENLEAAKLPSKDNIYLYRKTIYLTPANSKFIFFSEQDKRIALSLSNHSLETKLIELYRERLTVLNERPETEYLLSNPIQTADEIIDFRIDKLKGLLYGYYIGGLLSSSIQEVKRINQLREIENVFSAILSNLDGGVTEHQRKQLEPLLSDYEYHLNALTNSKNSPEENPEILWIKGQIKDWQRQMDNKRSEHTIKPEAQELTVSNYRFSSISPDRIPDEKGRELFKVWVEKVFCSPQFNGKISTNREELSDRLTEAALQFVYSNNSQNRVIAFLENLRRHVRGDAFNKEWKNSLLFSVAAVLIAGEEWTKLLRYMQGKEMTDYTLAFAIFGCLNGFAALPRDFTDVLYTQSSTYVEAVYNEFHRQLFGKQISIKIPVRKHPNLPSTPTVHPAMPLATPSTSPQTPKPSTVQEKNTEITPVQNDNGFQKFFSGVCKVCTTARKDETIYRMYYQKHKSVNTAFLDDLQKDSQLNKGRGVQKTIITHIEKTYFPKPKQNRRTKSPKNMTEVPSLFPDATSCNIIDDDNAVKVIHDCTEIPDNIKQTLTQQFIEFQKKYRPGGYYFKNPHKYQRNNHDVADHFSKWMLSDKNENHIEYSPENSKIMDKIKNAFLGKYPSY